MDNFVFKTKNRKWERHFSICKIYKAHFAKANICQREIPLNNDKEVILHIRLTYSPGFHFSGSTCIEFFCVLSIGPVLDCNTANLPSVVLITFVLCNNYAKNTL